MNGDFSWTNKQCGSIMSKKKGAIVIREAPERFKLEDTTIWSFPERGNWATHSGKYRGNWSPYIPRKYLFLRYSKEKKDLDT